MLSEVYGQDSAIPRLRRLTEKDVACALLIDGEEGTGRRFATTQAIKEALCSGTHEVGCTCYDCTQIDRGTHPDVTVVVPEGDKDLGIDAIRDLIEISKSYPSMSALRFFVIDGADRLTSAASNALLKTLEQPPPTSRFVLLTENYRDVMPTIRSRCGRITFSRLSENIVLSLLQRFESDPTKALVCARIADGSIGRAIRYWGSGRLHLRDQVLSLLELGLMGDLSSLFSKIEGIGQSLSLALRFLDQLLYDLLIMQYDTSRMINVDVVERLAAIRPKLTRTAEQKLVSGLRQIVSRSRIGKINTAFHLKTLFVDTFFVS
jgi:DNA polymerase-3 subunit delta'